jgi:hypothetical protein
MLSKVISLEQTSQQSDPKPAADFGRSKKPRLAHRAAVFEGVREPAMAVLSTRQLLSIFWRGVVRAETKTSLSCSFRFFLAKYPGSNSRHPATLPKQSADGPPGYHFSGS